VYGYAALVDLIGPSLSEASCAKGAVLHAVVTQLPAIAGPFSEKMSPYERAGAAVAGMLLLSAAPAVVALAAPGSAGTASGRIGSAGTGAVRGVSVSELRPGMSVSAILRSRAGGSSGGGQAVRESGCGDEDEGGEAAARPSARAVDGRLPPLHVTLVGVHGRYDARLSAAECVDMDPYCTPPAAATPADCAAAEAGGRIALAKYFELLDSPAGTVIQLKVAVVVCESRPVRRGDRAYGAPGRAVEGAAVESVHRIELTCRPADLSLPDLHLASCRPDWCSFSGDGSAEEGARKPAPETVIAASTAALAAAPISDCTVAATRDCGATSALVPGATGVGVVLGLSPADGHLWLGISGGVHARVALVDCGASPDVRDSVSGELIASPAVAAALRGPKVLELHPVGSLVSFVLLQV
jgi:hypothetical protein